MSAQKTRAGAWVATMAAALLAAAPATAADWRPTEPVELVIMAGRDGGADRLARVVEAIVESGELAPTAIRPVNKGGGSGAEALRYLAGKAGDAHTVMATLNSYHTTPLRTQIEVDIAEFTPLTRLAVDSFVLWVNADSGITDVEQYVEAVAAAGGEWRMGGTGTGQEDGLLTAMLERAFDVHVSYVPFAGGGQVAASLIAGEVDSTVNNPAEQRALWQAGESRPIATFGEERLDIMPGVPTMRELGYDIVYKMERSFVGPPDMPAAARAFYVDMFEQVAASEAWRTYAAEHALTPARLSGDALQAELLAERERHRELLELFGDPSG